MRERLGRDWATRPGPVPKIARQSADVAQLVERRLPKPRTPKAGSIRIDPFRVGLSRRLGAFGVVGHGSPAVVGAGSMTFGPLLGRGPPGSSGSIRGR